MSIKSAYEARVESLGLTNDPAQQDVVEAMQELQQQLLSSDGLFPKLTQALLPIARPAIKGLYLWGGVGRGKTFLMDLFVETLPLRKKRRVHFHRMMGEVHARLKALSHVGDPLDKVASDIARTTDVLCFDEFFVSDIADAMLLGRLLRGLFRRGVVLVATSNSPPSELYRNGLQRDRFLPAIDLLEENTRVMHIAGTTDYRLRLLRKTGTYISTSAGDAGNRLEQYFGQIASGTVEENSLLEVGGRRMRARKRARGIVWFTFAELCEEPRSARDYVEIARWHPTVILSEVPVLTAEHEDAARRFIALVDEFYDRRVKLILSAEADVMSLYRGRRLQFEFRRTTSRLSEMQTPRYLHSQHLP